MMLRFQRRGHSQPWLGALRALASRPFWYYLGGSLGGGVLGEQKNQFTLLSLCRDLNSPHILYSSDVLVPLEDWGPG